MLQDRNCTDFSCEGFFAVQFGPPRSLVYSGSSAFPLG